MKCSVLLFVLVAAASLTQATHAAPAGTLDPTFGEGQSGLTLVPFELGDQNNDKATAAALDEDGRIYLAGYAERDPADFCLALTRLTPDGLVDITFGPNADGRVCHLYPAFGWMVAHDMAMQTDGKFIVAGTAYGVGGSDPRFLACRFAKDGSPDPEFGLAESPGCHAMEFGADYADSLAAAVTIQTDGRIVLAGTTFDSNAGIRRAVLARLTPEGTMDDSFGESGFDVAIPELEGEHTEFLDVTQTTDGKLVAVGSTTVGPVDKDFLLVRFSSVDGSRDLEFGNFGIAQLAFDIGGNKSDVANTVRVLADNSIVVAGTVETVLGSQFRTAAAKYSADGSFDVTFGTGGKRVYNPCVFMFAGCEMQTSDMLVTTNGDFVFSGTFRFTPDDPDSADFFALRIDETGEPDDTFGVGIVGQEGMAYVDLAQSEDINARVLMQGKKLVLAGSSRFGSNVDFGIVRFGDGSLFSDSFENSP